MMNSVGGPRSITRSIDHNLAIEKRVGDSGIRIRSKNDYEADYLRNAELRKALSPS
jgi:hypothetical protein